MTEELAQPARVRHATPTRPNLDPGGRIKRVSDLLNLNDDTRERLFEEMTPRECAQLFHDWAFWARPEQAPPDGDWIIWLILAGRGAGKTRAGAEAVRTWVQSYPIVNLIGATMADARDIMVRGESGILACCRRDERPQYFAADLRLEWPNGAQSYLFSAEEPDRLRGKQHMKLWCLAGDTLVSMGDGSLKPLKSIRAGDTALTRLGARTVVASALTKRNAALLRLRTSAGHVVEGTPDHPVWIEGRGFIALASVRPGMVACVTLASNGAERSGIATKAAITRRSFDCIAKSGSKRTDQSRTASTFTTGTETKATTGLRIWNCFRMASTALAKSKRSLLRIASELCETLSPPGSKIARIVASGCSSAFNAGPNIRAAQGIRGGSVPRNVWRPREQARSRVNIGSANIVGRLISRPAVSNDIVRGYATPEPAANAPAPFDASTAPNVGRPSTANDRTPGSAAETAPFVSMATIASVERLAKRADVYDIAVDEQGEFFANGVLVHNCDELAAWRLPDAFDQAMLGLRLGDRPQAIVTTTPRPSKIIKALAAGKDTIVTRGSTFDNKAHLARAFFDRITARYMGRAIGRQELFAEIVEETPGALWTRALLERQRVAPEAAPKEFAEVVVAVDPPARSGSKSDECGLIVAAKAEGGLFYVLADLTSQGETPGAWGARVGAAFRGFKANRVVAEINQGGDMVTEVLRQSEPNLPVRAVHATRGKFLRAEPIAAAYERGLVFHVGSFGKLEDQLCALTPDFDRRAMGFSPDRADALVWALADLLGVGRGGTGGMYEFWTGR
jgi:phage terminase large subunit-like protein